jgi:hypothetical protein
MSDFFDAEPDAADFSIRKMGICVCVLRTSVSVISIRGMDVKGSCEGGWYCAGICDCEVASGRLLAESTGGERFVIHARLFSIDSCF